MVGDQAAFCSVLAITVTVGRLAPSIMAMNSCVSGNSFLRAEVWVSLKSAPALCRGMTDVIRVGPTPRCGRVRGRAGE